MRTYTELLTLPTFEERLEFLKTTELPSDLTFAQLRSLNQAFYNSRAWKQVRRQVIGRDLGHDLAIPGRDILGRVIVHHMNPIRPNDLRYNVDKCLDPEFLITVSNNTHNAIHFNTELVELSYDREPGDTTLW